MNAAHDQPPEKAEYERYSIGASVRCEDGSCGELSRVVVDPIQRAVTHLVVEPHHRHARARLVPVAMVAAADADEVRLRCPLATFRALQRAVESEFVRPDDSSRSLDIWGGGMGDTGVLGYPGAATMIWPHTAGSQVRVVHERVPLGEVEIRRGQQLHATDGTIGKVQGLVVDPTDQAVTHVLLHEGHLWGVKDVAISIAAVTDISYDGVHVSLSKDAITELPDLETEDP